MPMYYRAIELLFSADCINEGHLPLIDDLDQPDLQSTVVYISSPLLFK